MSRPVIYPEKVHVAMTVDEKMYIQKHCPQDVCLSRFIVSCCMLRCALMDDEKEEKQKAALGNGWRGGVAKDRSGECGTILKEHPEPEGEDITTMWPSTLFIDTGRIEKAAKQFIKEARE